MSSLHFWLTVVTASRWLCTPLWWWLWRKQGGGVVAARVAIIAWFGLTDYSDGHFARQHGLVTEWGGWLDHLADWAFALSVILLGMAESRFAHRPRRARRTANRAASTPPPADQPAPPP